MRRRPLLALGLACAVLGVLSGCRIAPSGSAAGSADAVGGTNPATTPSMSSPASVPTTASAVTSPSITPPAARAPTGIPPAATAPKSASPTGTSPAAARVYGVTVDDTTDVTALVDSIRRLGRPMAVRVVFDVDWSAPSDPAEMVGPVRELAAVATVYGELVDSQDLARITVAQMTERTDAYVRALGPWVSVWEVGNEVNGNWTGAAGDVAAKVTTAYHQVRNAGGRAAMTLYENGGCGDGPGELDPATWAARWLAADVRTGLDYVLLSYYETECAGHRPPPAAWTQKFAALHTLFPRARVGFGEIGLPDPATATTSVPAASIVDYYYRLPVDLPYYIGGGFYWYFAEDMVPASRPLWQTLRTAISGTG